MNEADPNKEVSVEQMMQRLRKRFEQAGLGPNNALKDPKLMAAKNNSRRPSNKKSPMSSQARIRKQNSILTDDGWIDTEMEGDLVSNLDENEQMRTNSSTYAMQPAPRIAAAQQQQHQQQQTQHQNQIQTLMVQFEMEKRAWVAQMHHIQLEWQADKARMAPMEQQYNELQEKARREKVDAQIQIDDLKKDLEVAKSEVAHLQAEKDSFQSILQQKDEDFQQMKVMVDNQMNQMRQHFLGLQQEHQRVLSLKESLTSQLKTSETQISDLRNQLQSKNGEVLECRQHMEVLMNKTKMAEAKLVDLQSKSHSSTTEANLQIQELQQKYGTLVQQHQQMYMMHENLKQNFVQVKVECATNQRAVQDLTARLQLADAEKKELIMMTEALLEGTENFSE